MSVTVGVQHFMFSQKEPAPNETEAGVFEVTTNNLNTRRKDMKQMCAFVRQ
jgi:hypothetical protein